MKRSTRRAYPLIALGAAFLGIGIAGRPPFIFVGRVFIGVGLFMFRDRS
ncbi:MAG: hypothetical protein LC774_07215 [Acidobacteria bacterium]|nr:hypothetical protein [Acidobacteriota bacterium]